MAVKVSVLALLPSAGNVVGFAANVAVLMTGPNVRDAEAGSSMLAFANTMEAVMV